MTPQPSPSGTSLCLAVVALAAACSSSTGATPAGGTADAGPGSPADAPPVGGGTPDAGPGGSSVTPLPAGTFVFLRRTNGTSFGTTHSIVAYDAAARQERLVTDLVDGGRGTEVTGHAVSPDRKSIAFTAVFRPSNKDITSSGIAEALWLVTVDGESFTRVSPPLPDVTTGGACSTDQECPFGWRCALPPGACHLPGSTLRLDAPAWMPDGAHLMFDIGMSSNVGGQISAGSVPWIIPVGGGLPTPVAPMAPCASVTDVAPDPRGGGFLAVHLLCLPPAHDGLYYHPDGGDPIEIASQELNGFDGSIPLFPPSWTSDGSDVVFDGSATVTIDGQDKNAGVGFLGMTADQSVQVLVAPPSLDQTVLSIAVAGDASFLAYCLHTGSTDASDIMVVDLRSTPPTTFPATSDGVSCSPRF